MTVFLETFVSEHKHHSRSKIWAMATNYQYRPIAPRSVRLVRILPDEEHFPVRCKLIHMPLHVTPPPEYIAVSYAWGDSTRDNRVIKVDGHDFTISENLWHVLFKMRLVERLESLRPYGPVHYTETVFYVRRPWLFWIDAICINQMDFGEKSREIPRMMEIYASAKEVLGWLGHQVPSHLDPAVLSTMLDKARDLQLASQKDEDYWTQLCFTTEASLQSALGVRNLDSFVDSVFAIALLPWFTRLWIIQEYAVAKISPVLFLGPHCFDAWAFRDLLTLFAYKPRWYQQPVRLACLVIMGRVKDRHLIHNGSRAPIEELAMPHTDNELDAFAFRLNDLLAITSLAPFQSKHEHDMIYGILGMANPPNPMPEELVVDYKSPWPEVCRRYAKFIAERTGSISFFSRIHWHSRDDDVPSWVPNLSLPSITFDAFSYRMVEKDRFLGCKITFSTDGRTMTLDGYVLGKPVAMTCRTGLVQKTREYCSQERVTEFSREDALDFVEEILRPAAQRQARSLEAVLTSWISAWERAVGFKISKESEASAIMKMFTSWIWGCGPEILNLDKSEVLGRKLSRRAQLVWQRLRHKTLFKNWLVTRDGRGWMAMFTDEVMPNDVVVVLRGIPEWPAVLREVGKPSTYTIVGLLIERVPLGDQGDQIWEHIWKEVFSQENYSWARINLV
jgi:hypothetical protein